MVADGSCDLMIKLVPIFAKTQDAGIFKRLFKGDGIE